MEDREKKIVDVVTTEEVFNFFKKIPASTPPRQCSNYTYKKYLCDWYDELCKNTDTTPEQEDFRKICDGLINDPNIDFNSSNEKLTLLTYTLDKYIESRKNPK